MGGQLGTPRHRRARRNLRSVGIRKILPQTTKLTDTKNILQIDALITFTEKDLRSQGKRGLTQALFCVR
jgi:hypothetical protein